MDEQLCPHCGARQRAYWHSLTPGLVSALVKLLIAVKHYNRNRIHIHQEMKAIKGSPFQLTDFEWNNMSALRFHALVAHADKENRRSGYWLITAKGGQFLRGEISVPKRVKTFRDKVIEHSPDLVHIRNFAGKTPEFESDKAYEYPRELVAKKAEQPKLFFAA